MQNVDEIDTWSFILFLSSYIPHYLFELSLRTNLFPLLPFFHSLIQTNFFFFIPPPLSSSHLPFFFFILSAKFVVCSSRRVKRGNWLRLKSKSCLKSLFLSFSLQPPLGNFTNICSAKIEQHLHQYCWQYGNIIQQNCN